MQSQGSLNELKIEIEEKRDKLNNLVIGSINKDELLKFSIELDELIQRYYKLELNKKRVDI